MGHLESGATPGRDGFVSFCIDAGGDIEVRGADAEGRPREVGIRSPFEPSLLIRKLHLHSCGIATSGTYIRGSISGTRGPAPRRKGS